MRYIIVAVVVSGVLGKLNERKKLKENKIKDLNDFKIYMDNAAIKIMDFSTLFWFGIAFAASFTTDESQKYFWISFAAWGFLSLIASLAIRKTIHVKEDTITVKKILLPSKTIKFSDITDVVTGDENTKFYKNNKLLFICDKDMTGYTQLLERITEESNKSNFTKASITRKDFLRSPALLFLAIMTYVLSLALAIPEIIEAETWIQRIEPFGYCLVLILPFLLIYLWFTPRSYFLIKDIEKTLNIDFDQEMRKVDITSLIERDNDDWFLCNPSMYNTIINKKYISKIISIKQALFDERVAYVTFETPAGKIRKIPIDDGNKELFKTWYNSK